jgi:hypothetical protein
MNDSQTPPDATPRSKMGQRWITVLCITLGINGLTVVGALADRTFLSHPSRETAGAREVVLTTENESEQTISDRDQTTEVTEVVETSSLRKPQIEAGEASNATAAVTTQDENANAVAEGIGDSNPIAKNQEAGAIEPAASENLGHAKVQTETGVVDNIVIINPPGTGGIVHFVMGDRTVSLMPAEYIRMNAQSGKRMAFHRGGDLGDVEMQVNPSAYQFNVSQTGWELAPIRPAELDRLLEICQPIH